MSIFFSNLASTDLSFDDSFDDSFEDSFEDSSELSSDSTESNESKDDSLDNFSTDFSSLVIYFSVFTFYNSAAASFNVLALATYLAFSNYSGVFSILAFDF